MQWETTNPTTFIWRNPATPPHGAQLSIQRVVQKKTLTLASGVTRVSILHYIFQASELASGNIKLQLNTEKDTDLRDALMGLYKAISADVDREGVDFLKNIIEGA